MPYTVTTTTGPAPLTTSRTIVHDSAELRRVLRAPGDQPRQHTVARDDEVIVHLVREGDLAHLSLWEGEICHYLCGSAPGETVDLGWNSYPAWSIVDLPSALAVAQAFLDTGTRDPARSWRSEILEL